MTGCQFWLTIPLEILVGNRGRESRPHTPLSLKPCFLLKDFLPLVEQFGQSWFVLYEEVFCGTKSIIQEAIKNPAVNNATWRVMYPIPHVHSVMVQKVVTDILMLFSVNIEDYYTTRAVRGPITKINQSKCSIAGPIFSKYWTGHCPEWSRTTCVPLNLKLRWRTRTKFFENFVVKLQNGWLTLRNAVSALN